MPRQEFTRALGCFCLFIIPKYLSAPSLLIVHVCFNLIVQENRLAMVMASPAKERLCQVPSGLVL